MPMAILRLMLPICLKKESSATYVSVAPATTMAVTPKIKQIYTIAVLRSNFQLLGLLCAH